MKISNMIGFLLAGSIVVACSAPNPNELVGGEPDTSNDSTQQADSNPAPDLPKGKTANYSSGTASVTEAGQSKGESLAGGEGLAGGAEAIPVTLSPGLFSVGAGVGYSNGSHFCTFSSWSDFVEGSGRTDLNGVPSFAGWPTGMPNDGACQIYYTGFFHFGFTYYGNGFAYCSCDHSSPPAREVARRPDGPYQGSCGGC